MEELKKIARENHYSENFVAFVGKLVCVPEYDKFVEGMRKHLPEKDLILLSFYLPPMAKDVPVKIRDENGNIEMILGGQDDPEFSPEGLEFARAEYKKWCDTDGNFQYDKYLNRH